ncbi:MAG: flagellar biosynthesis protein FlhB [Gammaproteobacteria bacterium]
MAQENEDGQEKTEEPTSRKLEKARESGQTPRSRELSAFLVLACGGLSFLFLGEQLLTFTSRIAELFFRVDRTVLLDPMAIGMQLRAALFFFIKTILLFLLMTFLSSIVGPLFMGGWNFSLSALAPKLSKLNPLKGLKRMFSVSALVEMIKAMGKFFLIAVVAVMVVVWQVPTLMHLPMKPVNVAMGESISVLIWAFLALVASLLVIVLIDVPFQLWNHAQQIRMTKQEVKDEHKDSEGKPEVKGQIRRMQREMAQRRMMDKVAEADVVITNPTHYAVALRYAPEQDDAPILIAKGKNLIALKIRDIAQENVIPVLEAPMLARSVYHTTELNQEIPAGLYVAVAQVLAYVHQVRAYRAGRVTKPRRPNDYPVPPDLRFDE